MLAESLRIMEISKKTEERAPKNGLDFYFWKFKNAVNRLKKSSVRSLELYKYIIMKFYV